MSDAEQVERLFAITVERFGRVDVSFHNAGISPPEDDSILTTDLDAWRRVQDVNLTSVYLCCKAVLPHMQRQGKGSIVNTASFVATMGSATSQISYTASKGGVLALSRELGVQFAREGIRVNALCPGPVNTPLLEELFAADPERARSDDSCTCPWVASPNPRRSRPRSRSSPATTRRSSPRPPFWWTAGSPAPTSPRSDYSESGRNRNTAMSSLTWSHTISTRSPIRSVSTSQSMMFAIMRAPAPCVPSSSMMPAA